MKTNCRRILTIALLSASPLSFVTLAAPAAAQERSYDIKAQPLAAAVLEYSRQSGVFVLAPMDLVKGKKAPAVRGNLTAAEALSKLLSGSGLRAVKGSNGGMALVRASAPGNAGTTGGNGQGADARPNVSQSNAQFVDVPAASASTVVDARTGAALKGALVEITETGEKTSTGDLGEFRFPGKTGSFSLRISYLGYPQYEQFVDLKDGRATSGILLSDGSAVGEIVVTAYQSARAQALNQERTADNVSTVLSSDLLGQFNGTTVSDALRRAPGIAFQRDGGSNEGDNVIIRGLGSSFNTVTFNGLRLPVGDGESRTAQLGNLLTDSISDIVINKTLLPNQDGSGTGGLIDIRTKGPLDRARRYGSLSFEGAKTPKGFLDEFGISGLASARFGADGNFGISGNLQYRKKNQSRFSGNASLAFGQYLPATDDGRPVFSVSDIHPLRAFPFEDGVDQVIPTGTTTAFADNRTENLTGVVSAQWQIANHTNLRLDYTFARSRSDDYYRSASFFPASGYEIMPVAEAGGEDRPAFVWENFDPFSPALTAYTSQNHSITSTKRQSHVLSFIGETAFDKWAVKYKLGYTSGTQKTPVSQNLSLFASQASFGRDMLDPRLLENTINGRIVSPYLTQNDYSLAQPALTAAGFQMLNDPNRYVFGSASSTGSSGSNKRKTAAVDVQRDFSAVLNYVQVGGFWEQSKSKTKNDFSRDYEPTDFDLPISAYGLEFGDSDFSTIGRTDGLSVISRAALRDFWKRIDSLSGSAQGLLQARESTLDPRLQKDGLTEDNFAAYFQTKIDLGRLEFVGGARYEVIRTDALVAQDNRLFNAQGAPDVAFNNDPANRTLISYQGTNYDFLPRGTLNYRFNDNVVARLGYYRSISRPDISSLASITSLVLRLRPNNGPNRNQPQLIARLPSPDLKDSKTDNLDFSVEVYDKDVGVVKFGAFYKRTKDPFFNATVSVGIGTLDGIELPDDPRFQNLPSNTYIVGERIVNGDTATKAWGLEGSVEHRFTWLPGLLGGFGIYANYTYADSKRDVVGNFLGEEYVRKGVPYLTQPKHSGTAALTYSLGGVDANLAYTRQSRFAAQVGDYDRWEFIEGYETLDFRASLDTKVAGVKTRIFAEVSDILRGRGSNAYGTSVGTVDGSISNIFSGSYYGGRSFRLGTLIQF